LQPKDSVSISYTDLSSPSGQTTCTASSITKK
jgi:hypothetical protein